VTQEYECHNPECDLGGTADVGQFTGGRTEEIAWLRKPLDHSREPKEGVDFGEGICPNCGVKGKKAGV